MLLLLLSSTFLFSSSLSTYKPAWASFLSATHFPAILPSFSLRPLLPSLPSSLLYPRLFPLPSFPLFLPTAIMPPPHLPTYSSSLFPSFSPSLSHHLLPPPPPPPLSSSLFVPIFQIFLYLFSALSSTCYPSSYGSTSSP